MELATRFAPYIEELHDVFVMHGLHYGSPEDIRLLAGRLDGSGLLCEELAALVRSIVLREGGAIPRTDLLEIFATSIAGPRMDPGGEELQVSVRQLLSFLHHALRRPWNEPPGEERLHPEDEGRAHELRSGAIGVETERHGLGSERPIRPARLTTDAPDGGHVDVSVLPANVIPFGRARAVFSRLARMEPGYEESDAAYARGEQDLPSVAQSAPMKSAAIPQADAVQGPDPVSPPRTPMSAAEICSGGASADAFLVPADAYIVQSEVLSASCPSEPIGAASSEMEFFVAAGSEIVEMEPLQGLNRSEETQREEAESEATEPEPAPVPVSQHGVGTLEPVEPISAVIPTDAAGQKPLQIAESSAAPQPAAAAIKDFSGNAKIEAEPPRLQNRGGSLWRTGWPLRRW